MLCYYERVVGVSHIHHCYHRIIIDEVIYFLRSHKECRNQLSFVDSLVRAVDHALLHEFEHSVCKHLCMNSEILMISELGKDCIRNGTDTHLKTCSVVDERRTMLSYGNFHFIRLAEMCRLQWRVSLYKDIDHFHRDHCLAPCSRNILIYNRDDSLCTFDCSQSRVNRCSQRYITMLVGRTYLYHSDVARKRATSI